MKIAINCSICQPKGGGITEYIENLTRNLDVLDESNEYVLYVIPDYLDYCKKVLPSRFKIKTIPFVDTLYGKIKRSLFSQDFWYREEYEEKFILFHSPFFYAPKFRRAKVLLTVHDLRLYRFPSTYSLLRYLFLYHSVKESIKRADRIISISDFTKKEIVDTCGVDGKKIVVIPEAINRDDFNPAAVMDSYLDVNYKYLNNTKYILSVSHLEPRKNFERLVDAFILLKNKYKDDDLKLIIVGQKNNGSKRILNKIEKASDVIHIDFVSREFLLWLYKNATLFVFPSYYEGFGFPPMEASSMGVLSVVSNCSSIPEVCGDCAIYFNPYDVKDIAEAMLSGLVDKKLIKDKKLRIEDNLSRFSWKSNAEETLTVYQELKEIM